MVYIGIDVGATTIKIGIVDQHGSILVKDSCLTLVRRGYQAMVDDMVNLSKKLLSESGHTMADVHSVGIGIPGMQDMRTHRVPFCTNLQWHDVPLEEIMRERMGVPVYVNNDANVAALAEAKAGATKNVKNSVVVTLGTGVGGGVILNGKLFTGSHGVATEVGHIVIKDGGEMCTCGNTGCWERYASATALIREGRKFAEAHPDSALCRQVNGDLSQIAARTVIDLAKTGDADCLKLFDDYCYYLALGLVNLINVYDPEIIALGGGVSGAGDFLLDRVKALLPGMVFFKTMEYADVVLCRLGNDAGIIGAAMLGTQEEE